MASPPSCSPKNTSATYNAGRPSAPESASISRSRTSQKNTKTLADEMSRVSLSSGHRKELIASPTGSASLPISMLRSGKQSTYVDTLTRALRDNDIPACAASISRSSLRGDVKTPSYHTMQNIPVDAWATRKSYRTVFAATAQRPPPLPAGRMPPPSASGWCTMVDEAKKRKAELDKEVRVANAKAGPCTTTGTFREMTSIDLLFITDTTSSMTPYLEAAKVQVRSIVADFQKTFFNERQVRQLCFLQPCPRPCYICALRNHCYALKPDALAPRNHAIRQK